MDASERTSCARVRRSGLWTLCFGAAIVVGCGDSVVPDASSDSGRDVVTDVVTSDVARDASTSDVAIDAATMDASRGCASSAECAMGTYCEFTMGCENTRGTCVSRGCESLPTVGEFCTCEGTSLQIPSACQPSVRWRSLGTCPRVDAGSDASDASDAMTSARYANAVMVWQSPGGFAGWGPAVMVSGDGSVRFWENRTGFSLDEALSMPPSRAERVSVADVDDLFDRWTRTSVSMLPHRGTSIDCYPVVTVRLRTSDPAHEIRYTTPASLLPEMSSVWMWFETRYGATGPQTYCSR
ncbi:MAG: hypothetical protein Q8Q09_05810 [Deltaproteobacteria bacterium]|nr:hypothetical protein [Deltaproteobacteria bacterium]